MYLGSLDAPDQLTPTYESWIVRRESLLPQFPFTRFYDHDRDVTSRLRNKALYDARIDHISHLITTVKLGVKNLFVLSSLSIFIFLLGLLVSIESWIRIKSDVDRYRHFEQSYIPASTWFGS